MKSALALLVAATVLGGCASAITERTATKYTYEGFAAELNNDWDRARRAFARAVFNSEMARMPPGKRAVLFYEYGRSLGVTCFFDKSERALNTAYQLDKEAGQPLFLSLVELSRLSLDQARYQDATVYFERAISALDTADVTSKAPRGYADVLDEYARALDGVGRAADAKRSSERAAAIRASTPDKRSITDRTPYGKYCTKQG
jgi:tetratricopeptide (TPR) repeat protein